MSLEQMQMLIDLLGKSQSPRHHMDHANPSASNPLITILHLISNVDPLEHWLLLVFPVSAPQTFLNFSLALSQYFFGIIFSLEMLLYDWR